MLGGDPSRLHIVHIHRGNTLPGPLSLNNNWGFIFNEFLQLLIICPRTREDDPVNMSPPQQSRETTVAYTQRYRGEENLIIVGGSAKLGEKAP